MRVLLAGASGALGGPLVRQLVAADHTVFGITRSHQGAERISAEGGNPIVADVMDRDALLPAVRGERFDTIIHELTALKKAPLRHGDMHETDVLRTDGTAHLLEVAEATGAGRFVVQSMVFGYGYTNHGTTPLTEESPFGVPVGNPFDPHVAAMLSAEHQALNTPGIDGVALRYGLFYGADIDAMAAMLRKRALPTVRRGGEIAFIHHTDAAAATVAALELARPGGTFNIVDDTPATFPQLIATIADAKHAPRPIVLPGWALALAAPYGKALFGSTSMRVSNERAKSELDWRPRYPSIWDGLGAKRPAEGNPRRSIAR
jgi:nucleoside-diphosphate-sugar epimerase